MAHLPDLRAIRFQFEPVPLYRVMSEKGFTHVTERRGPAEWVVRFTNVGITGQA